MRRRLILMRHAKSSWKSDAIDDHGRPLNKRGRRDAPLIASELNERGWLPELVYSSDSERTRQTLHLMLPQFEPAPAVELSHSLYLGGIHEIREAVVASAPEIATILVLGHNPGWQNAVTWLSGDYEAMTTANAALLETEGESWREVLQDERSWQLVEVIRPKELATDE